MFRWFLALIQSYFFIILISLAAGLLFPLKVVVLAPFATLFLQIIFFLTSLKLDPQAVLKEFRHPKALVIASLFMLLVLPAFVFVVAQALVPSLAIALLLLAAMPTGMTAPLLADVVGGKATTALVLTVMTSLLAPFTIPLVISLFASTAVTVSAGAMVWSLVKVILIPFFLAQCARHFLHTQLQPTYFTFKPISLVLLGLLIAGVVSKQAETILAGVGSSVVFQLLVLTGFIILLLGVGFNIAFWRPVKDRLTIAVSVTFMNFTLAIFLAGAFFNDPTISLATVLIIFPWSLVIVPLRKLVRFS